MQPMTADEFQTIAELKCKRWSKQSLDCAYRILVNGESPSFVADSLGYKRIQQVYVNRDRFLEKKEQVKVQLFMSENAPEEKVDLDNFLVQIKFLCERGYSANQIADFLQQECAVYTSSDQVAKFIKGLI